MISQLASVAMWRRQERAVALVNLLLGLVTIMQPVRASCIKQDMTKVTEVQCTLPFNIGVVHTFLVTFYEDNVSPCLQRLSYYSLPWLFFNNMGTHEVILGRQ